MSASSWLIWETDKIYWISVEICIWNIQRRSVCSNLFINWFDGLHKWKEKILYI